MNNDAPESIPIKTSEDVLLGSQSGTLNYGDNDIDDLIDEWASIIKGLLDQAKTFSELAQGENLALMMLSRTSEGLSSGKLSSIMEVTSGRMSNILHQLEEKGLIVRTVNPLNKRMTVITITDKGILRVKTIEETSRDRIAEVLRRLGREDSKTLIRIFKKLGDTSNTTEDFFTQLKNRDFPSSFPTSKGN